MTPIPLEEMTREELENKFMEMPKLETKEEMIHKRIIFERKR